MSLNWGDVLKKWNSGDIPTIPNNIKKPFLWRTSAVDKDKKLMYREEFIEDKRLVKTKHNYDLYKGKPLEILSKKHKNKYVVKSMNLQKDTMQIIPKPVKGKNFANIYYFMKNASIEQQKEVWKQVVKETNKMLKEYPRVYISSQGLRMDYFHIKISICSKFYEKSPLQYFLSNKSKKSKKTKETKKSKKSKKKKKTKKSKKYIKI